MKIPETSQHARTRSFLISDEGLESFGRLLVKTCMYSREFFEVAVSIIDYDASQNEYTFNDFLDGDKGTSDGLVFTCMLEFKKHHYEGNPYPLNNREWQNAIMPHLKRKFEANPDWPSSFMNEAIRAMVLGYTAPSMGDMDLACDGLVDYVKGVRIRAAAISLKGQSPSEQEKILSDVKTTLRLPGQESQLYTVEQHFEELLQSQQRTHSFRMGVRAFDRMYGEHAEPGDAWLAAGLPGAGKTVLSCQLTGATAAIGKKVLLITSEVAASTCVLRACASSQGIQYSSLQAIKGRNNLDALDLGIQLKEWMQTVGKNIFAIDYAKMPGAEFEDKMQTVLNLFFRVHHQMPEMVVFDWMGAAAAKGYDNPWEKREHFLSIGKYMANLADELGIVTWTLAQADPSIRNKVDIADSAIADCKALSQPFEGVLFMTSLMEAHKDGDQIEDAYQQKQWLTIPKCRNRPPKKIPVLRRFELQMFDDAR